MPFPEAVQYLLDLAGTTPASGFPPREAPNLIARTPDDPAKRVYTSLFNLSHEPSPSSPGGAYLRSRGFDIDFIHNYFVSELSHPTRVGVELVAEYGEDRVRAAGLILNADRFLFARHTLLFFYVTDGFPQFVQARDITGKASCKELSLAGLHSPVPFNADVLTQGHDRVFVCEGCIDTLSAERLGYPAVGVPGVDFPTNGERSDKSVSST